MRSKQGGIKTWLIFTLIIFMIFGSLYYFRNNIPGLVKDSEITEDVKTPSKKFAVATLSDEKKEELDTIAVKEALSSGNPEDCEDITYDDDLKQQCLDSIGYASIVKSGDESQCDKLFNKELREQCLNKIYYSDSMNALDSSLCKKITDKVLEQRCLDQIQAVMGKEAKSADDCDSISDPALRQECKNSFYYASSIENLDIDGCDNILNSQLRLRCASTVSRNQEVIEISDKEAESAPKTTQEILSACDNYSGDLAQNCKDDTNYELALENKDLSYCNRISDTSAQKECIEKQGDNINQYYFRQGTAYSDASLCNKITNTSLKTLCLDSI